MTTRHDHKPQHGVTRDLPLPGHYGVLTMQLNVTRYHPSGQVRWVMVMREPNSGLELERTFVPLSSDGPESDAAIFAAIAQALTSMLYLQTGTNR